MAAKDVFSLIGPKLRCALARAGQQGWIAETIAAATGLAPRRPPARLRRANAQYRIAAENPAKLAEQLVERRNDQVLIIGRISINWRSRRAGPLITGKTATASARSYARRLGRTKLLIVSKVANCSIDLPTPTWRSDIQHGRLAPGGAQRLAVLRPKASSPAQLYAGDP